MKATTLIAHIQAAVEQHGDQDIYIHDADTDWLLPVEYMRLADNEGESYRKVSGIVIAGSYGDYPPGDPEDLGWQELEAAVKQGKQ